VDCRSSGRGASRQTPELANFFKQPLVDQLRGYADAGIMMHLPQVGFEAEPPGFGKLSLSICPYLSVVNSTFI
jgi:hypothetical protein